MIWLSANSATLRAVTGITTLAWTVAGSGDYNGDGRSDILWRNTSTGANVIWLSATSTTSQAVATLSTAWKAVGSGDYDGDHRADILWRNTSNGANGIWRSGNSATPQVVTAMTSQAWTVIGSTE
jgi:hypothetical protein